MKPKRWQTAALVMALIGAASVAEAKGPGGGRKTRGDSKGARPGAEEILKKYDKDGSGELSASELEQFFRDQKERMPQRGGPDGRSGKGRMSREEMIKKYDTDGDGRLSEEERAARREDLQKRRGDR